MELSSRSLEPTKADSSPISRVAVRKLLGELCVVWRWMREFERDHRAELAEVATEHRLGARNLLHYLALKQHELTNLQRRLDALGLPSSIGASEPDVALQVWRVCRLLEQMSGTRVASAGLCAELARPRGTAELSRNSAACFGPPTSPGEAHTMVTLPAAAAFVPSIVAELAEAGMSVARIDASQGDRSLWTAMVGNLRCVEERLGRRIRLCVDLPSSAGCDLPDTLSVDFAIAQADLVGYASASPTQLASFQQLLSGRAPHLAVVLRLETRSALEQLSALLLQAMRSPRLAVMIARSELALELGALELAEAQEQLLFMSEAAHLPVIWATQVPPGQREGLASRAELSDALLSVRAECVMIDRVLQPI